MLVLREVQAAAEPAGIVVNALDGTTSAKVSEAFASMRREHMQALIVATTSSLLPQRHQIVQAAERARLPAIYARREYVEAGGLLSYGTEFGGVFARGADYVVRILRGTKPSDLPFEMASTFTLTLNPAAARRIGLEIPQAVRIRADNPAGQ
jgi:putative ABC transport system substrate-binding protein